MPTLFVGSRSGCIREVDCNSEYSADVFLSSMGLSWWQVWQPM